MYRIDEIKKALKNLVGWEQGFTQETEIGDDLLESESGLIFQQTHPLLTLENLRAVMPKEWMEEGRTFSQFVGRFVEVGISKVIQGFIRQKLIDKESRLIIDHRNLVEGNGRAQNFISPTGKLVGIEIKPLRHIGVTTKIDKIGLQMTGATGKVRVYLFHSSQSEPVKSENLDFTKEKGGFQWFDVKDWFLPYESDEIAPGGSWFVCYDQNALPEYMRAVNLSKDWSREPCGSCNQGNLETWRELMKYVRLMPFMYPAEEGWSEDPQMWDLDDSFETATQSYGLNFQMSIGCDLTDFIIRQRRIFADAVQLQVACDCLRYMALNPDVRVNRNQMNVERMDILYEIDGNTNGVRPNGLGNDLKQAMKALKIDTQGLDPVCLACNNHGVRYRAV